MLPPVSRPSDWSVRAVHESVFDHRHIRADYARTAGAAAPSQVKARRAGNYIAGSDRHDLSRTPAGRPRKRASGTGTEQPVTPLAHRRVFPQVAGHFSPRR